MISNDFLADLERELVLVHRRHRDGHRPARRARLRFAVAVAALAAAVFGIVQVAGHRPAERSVPPAGDRLDGGPPPRDDRQRAFTPRTGRLLALRVADPDGGPPWGLRLGTTYAGLKCLQVGRVVDGELGYLGVAGSAGDDGAFHPLPVRDGDGLSCAVPDAEGNAFLATRYSAMRRSGRDTGCTPVDRQPLPPGVEPAPAPRNPCADADVRFVSMGLLGPEARSITYPDSGGELVAQEVGEGGAYLVVRRHLPGEDSSGGVSPGPTPTGNAFTSARYADGSSCRPRVGETSDDPSCPARGYVAVDAPVPTPAQLATTATAHVRPSTLTGQPILRVVVRFRARRPARDGAFYGLAIRRPKCGTGGQWAIPRTVRAGDAVTGEALLNLPCRGTVTGRVVYQPAPDAPYVGGPYTGSPRRQVTAARFSAAIPSGR